MSTSQIYIITHKPIEGIAAPRHYRKLFVGAHRLSLQEKSSLKEYDFDDSGANISEKNSNYCELTGLYWIWKNREAEYVGITHYRRFFEEAGALLPMGKAKAILQKADIIVARRQWVERNVKVQFERFHRPEDLALARRVIQERHPDYLESFDLAMSKCFLFSYNMMICKKELFDRYCAWLFDILEGCEAKVDLEGCDAYQKRIFGFLSERLLMVYLLRHGLKAAEVKVLETEVPKSTQWESKKWEWITIAKNFFTNRGLCTLRYGKPQGRHCREKG